MNLLRAALLLMFQASVAMAAPDEDPGYLAAYDAHMRGNIKQAIALYRKSAKDGNPKSLYNLARIFMSGAGGNRDEARAVELYREAADRGMASAAYNLGVYYVRTADARQAERWFERATQLGHAGAWNGLGRLAHAKAEESGAPADYETAKAYFLNAIDAGSEDGYCDLGVFLSQKDVPSYQPEEALEAFKKGASLGIAECYFGLGDLYSGPRFFDLRDAGYWLETAYDAGIERASQELALLTLRHGGQSSRREAVKWLKIAARRGYRESQFLLGKHLETGDGVERDLNAAAVWYRRASESGHPEAKRALAALTSKYPDLGQAKTLPRTRSRSAIDAPRRKGARATTGKAAPTGVVIKRSRSALD